MDYQLKSLVERAKAGDNDAIEEILKKVKPLILSSISKCHSIVMDDDDLYQEAAIEVIYSIKDFDDDRNIPFLAFLKKRIFYRLKNLTRCEQPLMSLDQPVGDVDSACTMADTIPDAGPSVEDIVQMGQQYWHLRMAMAALTPKQRRVLKMYYMQGMSMADISRKDGLHYQAVVKLKERALNNMRIFMENDI
jgi:RNA polymerase sporulation-specific sigma factor